MSEQRLIKYINEAQIPDSLSPQSIAEMLKTKKVTVSAHAARIKKIRQTISYVGALAACLLIVSSAALNSAKTPKKSSGALAVHTEFRKAENYDELYTYMKKSGKKYDRYCVDFVKNEATDMMTAAEENETTSGADAEPQNTEHDYSGTITQSENVDEADMVKTDGENIFYTSNGNLYWAKSQEPLSSCRSYTLNDSCDEYNDYGDSYETWDYGYTDVCEMYLDGDTLSVLYSKYNTTGTYIKVYKINGDDLTLTQNYSQSGRYCDSRMVNGILYIVSDDSGDYYDNIDSPDDTDDYIPEYTCMDDKKLIAPDDIYIPQKIEPSSCLNYAVVGAVNTNDTQDSSSFTAFAGFDGEIYCTKENLYIANSLDSGNTQIIKIALNGTKIAPSASAEIKGTVLDQFSMDEYNGYFRVATSVSAYSKRNSSFIKSAIDECLGAVDDSYYEEINMDDNSLYVLDSDLNIVSSLKGYGKDEQIKSVNFQQDTAYVVTFRQTDPLFEIDLSDPSAPVITDEFKISGFSTFLHKWSDGLLLGFGSEATEQGFTTGVKVTMFNTQSDETTACDTYSISDDTYSTCIYSYACSDRKALLIDPDKNLIGFPVTIYSDNGVQSCDVYSYIFLSFDGEHFVQTGKIDSQDFFTRAVFIDDYIYTFTDKGIQKTSINGFETSDSFEF